MSVTLLGRLPGGSRLAIPERRLPPVLAVIAGMVDLISFVSLGGVFTAHITGNLVVLAAVAIRGGPLNLAQALAVPMFIVAVAGAWFLMRVTGKGRAPAARGALVVQFLLLAAVLIVCVSGSAAENPQGLAARIAVLLAASAMASQNALLHLQIAGAPSTAVMTGNLVSAVISALDAFSPCPERRGEAHSRLASVLPLLLGFLLGCLVAASGLLLDRNWGWSLPTALAGVVAILPWKREQ